MFLFLVDLHSLVITSIGVTYYEYTMVGGMFYGRIGSSNYFSKKANYGGVNTDTSSNLYTTNDR